MKEKKILVSFSGGLDSTYLIYDNLKKGNRVAGVYTTIKNNENKSEVERYQIRELDKLFSQDFPGMFELHMGTEISFSWEVRNLHLKQISIWLLSLLYDSYDCDEVQIGAVMNDDLISFLDDIKKTWKSYSWLYDNPIPLTFPLSKTSKYEIVKNLPEKYKGLVVYCEDPIIIKHPDDNNGTLEFRNCEKCQSCKRYKYDCESSGIRYGQDKSQDTIPNYYASTGYTFNGPPIEINKKVTIIKKKRSKNKRKNKNENISMDQIGKT